MGTTTDKLNKLIDTKSKIKEAIVAKGQTVSDSEPFSTYADKISDIETGYDTSAVTATADDVLSGKVIVDADGNPLTGTMANKGYPEIGSMTQTSNTAITNVAQNGATGRFDSNLSGAGYYTGAYFYVPNCISSNIKSGVKVGGKNAYLTGSYTSDATATADDIKSGKTAYVNGNQLTGTITDNGAVQSSLNCGSSYTIPQGYHNGSGTVSANSLSSQTQATATAADITSGKTAYVNGNKITGNYAKRTLISAKLFWGVAPVVASDVALSDLYATINMQKTDANWSCVASIGTTYTPTLLSDGSIRIENQSNHIKLFKYNAGVSLTPGTYKICLKYTLDGATVGDTSDGNQNTRYRMGISSIASGYSTGDECSESMDLYKYYLAPSSLATYIRDVDFTISGTYTGYFLFSVTHYVSMRIHGVTIYKYD